MHLLKLTKQKAKMDPNFTLSVRQSRNAFFRFKQAIKSLGINLKENADNIILNDVDLQQIFKVSSHTTKVWRDKNLIAYSRIGNHIVYKASEIHAFLTQNHSSLKRK